MRAGVTAALGVLALAAPPSLIMYLPAALFVFRLLVALVLSLFAVLAPLV